MLWSYEGGVINYVLAGVTPDGKLAGAYWDGTAEMAIVIDPATAATDLVGKLGDLARWEDQLVYTPGSLFAFGWGPGGAAHVYTLPLAR